MTPEEKEANYKIAEKLLAEQNFSAAVFFGIWATILAGAAWAVIAVAAGYVIGYIAIALGVVVGLAVRYTGRGIDNRFSVLAATLAIVGCLAGPLFAAILVEARHSETPLAEIVSSLTPDVILDFFAQTLSFVHVLFWVLAAGSAAYFAKRPLTREQGVAVYTWRRRPEEFKIIS